MRLRHPNIVQVIDVGQQENRHFMIMEYVEGMNLRDFMKLRTRITPEQACRSCWEWPRASSTRSSGA